MSSINPNNINGQYPVAGQDNDSQGFRDNFTNIINNFTFAYNEINDLQQNALLKNPLSGTSLSNDMNYAQLVKPKLLNVVHTQNSLGDKNAGFNISWLDGDFQKFTTKGSGAAGADDCTIAFTNWPANGTYAKIRLQVTTSANVANLTFPTTVSNVGIQSIQGWTSGQTIKLEGSGVYQFEVASSTNGDLLTVQDLLRNHNVSPSYQISAPTANVAVTALRGKSRLILTPIATISFGANVLLPDVNVDGTTFSISSNVATTLQVYGPAGTSVSPSANVQLTAGTSASYLYYATDTKWYKIA
jgi:hypothetical protein